MTEKYNSPKPTHEHVELAETTPAVARLLKSGVPRGTIEGAEELQLREKDVGMLQALRFEWRIVLCCLVYLGAALGQGLDNGVGNITNAMPGFLMAFGDFDPVTQSLSIPSIWLSLWTAMTALGNAIGSLMAGAVIDRFGTKKSLWALCVASVAAIAIQVWTQSRGQLLAGKILNGIPQGAFVAVAATYISETAGVRVRSTLLSLIAFMIMSGVTMGVGVGVHQIAELTPWKSFRLLYALQWLLPVIISGLLIFTPDSPAHLLRKGDVDGARRAILHLYGSRSAEQLEHRLVLIQLALAAEEEEAHATGSSTYLDCFHGVDRTRTLTVISVFVTMQFSGIALGSNTTYFLSQIPTLPFAAVFDLSLGFLGLSAIVNLFGPVMMEKSGRRLLFVYGNGVQAAILLALGALYYSTSNAGAWALGILYNLAIVTAQLTTSCSGFTIAGELSSLRLRAKTQSIGYASYYVLGWLLQFVTPFVFQSPGNAGVRVAWMYAGLTVLATALNFFIIPETRGLSYEDIDHRYSQHVKPRHFDRAVVASLEEQRKE